VPSLRLAPNGPGACGRQRSWQSRCAPGCPAAPTARQGLVLPSRPAERSDWRTGDWRRRIAAAAPATAVNQHGAGAIAGGLSTADRIPVRRM